MKKINWIKVGTIGGTVLTVVGTLASGAAELAKKIQENKANN